MSDLINILSIIDDKSQLINFPKLDPNSFKPAVLTLIQRLKDTVKAVKSSNREPTWDTLVTPIEDASENLSYVWSVVEHLNSVADTPELRVTINELLPPISEVFSELGMDEKLYAKYKALKAEKAFEKFSATRQRVINKELEGFVLAGAELDEPGKKKMADINREEAELSQKFSENLLDCTNEFALYLPEDTDELKGVPEAELHLLLSRQLPKAPKATKSPCICRIICPSCSTQKTEIFARRCITHTLPVHLISLRQARTIFRSSTVCLNFVLKMLTSWAIKTSLKFPWFGKWPSLPNRSFLSCAS